MNLQRFRGGHWFSSTPKLTRVNCNSWLYKIGLEISHKERESPKKFQFTTAFGWETMAIIIHQALSKM